MMAILGREAAYTGQKVAYNDALNSTTRLGPTEYEFGKLATPPVPEPGATKLNR
jgi:hypothetical protein